MDEPTHSSVLVETVDAAALVVFAEVGINTPKLQFAAYFFNSAT